MRLIAVNGKEVEERLSCALEEFMKEWAPKKYDVQLYNHTGSSYIDELGLYQIYRVNENEKRLNCGRFAAFFRARDANCGKTKKYGLTCAHVFQYTPPTIMTQRDGREVKVQNFPKIDSHTKSFSKEVITKQFDAGAWRLRKHNNKEKTPQRNSESCKCDPVMLNWSDHYNTKDNCWFRKACHDSALVEIPNGFNTDGFNDNIYGIVNITRPQELHQMCKRRVKMYVDTEDWGVMKQFIPDFHDKELQVIKLG